MVAVGGNCGAAAGGGDVCASAVVTRIVAPRIVAARIKTPQAPSAVRDSSVDEVMFPPGQLYWLFLYCLKYRHLNLPRQSTACEVFESLDLQAVLRKYKLTVHGEA